MEVPLFRLSLDTNQGKPHFLSSEREVTIVEDDILVMFPNDRAGQVPNMYREVRGPARLTEMAFKEKMHKRLAVELHRTQLCSHP
jgi:hypothetical protein